MHNREKQALLIAVFGFSTFAVGDAIIKTIAGAWPGIAAAALRFSIATLILGVFLAVREGRAAFVFPRPAIQLMRGFGITVGTAAFFSALFLLPLAECTAIYFVSPMITTLLATVFLGEPARKSVWFAMVIAFFGVIVLLRPNFSEYGWAVLLPLAAAFGMSLLVLGNRLVAGLASGLAMQFYSASIATIMLTMATFAFSWTSVPGMTLSWPEWSVIVRCFVVAFTASCGHWLVYTATTRAGATTVAPMAYSQMLISLVAGWLLFRDWPDMMSMVGAAMIVGAGLMLYFSGKAEAVAETDVP